MNKFRDFLSEAILILPDVTMDNRIKNDLGNDSGTYTFEYNAEAVAELAKHWGDVYVTKDKKYFHIASSLDKKLSKILDKVIKDFNLKKVT